MRGGLGSRQAARSTSGAQRGHRAQMARARLPGGCSVPCFPRSDIQQGDVAAAPSSPPGTFGSVLFPYVPPSQARLLPVVTSSDSQGVVLSLESFTAFPPVAPGQVCGFPRASFVPLGSCSDLTWVRPRAASAGCQQRAVASRETSYSQQHAGLSLFFFSFFFLFFLIGIKQSDLMTLHTSIVV